MSQQFNKCVENDGYVRTKELGKGRYMHICFPKGGGPSVAGEVKTKQKVPSRSKVRSEIRKEYGA